MKVYLLTIGDGSDGSEWMCLGIYSTRGLAEQAQHLYQRPRYRRDGSAFTLEATVEEWNLDQPLKDVDLGVAKSAVDWSKVCSGMGGSATGPKCCERAGEYNGFGSGPTIFTCPVHCGCHD